MNRILSIGLAAALLCAPLVGLQTASAAAQTATAHSSAVAQLTEANFDAEVRNFDGLVVVDLYADWCGPCKMYQPILEGVAESLKDNKRVKFMRLDGDGNRGLVEKLGGTAFPTTFFFMKDAGGALKFGTQTGVIEGARLSTLIDKIASGGIKLKTEVK